ncbi:MAG: hypothetical protein GF353_04815 [Candidatus Lokiarchaeota archaeon]|nr:hypothetical protein [Candidatus Lokiarchaeota archaeon]
MDKDFFQGLTNTFLKIIPVLSIVLGLVTWLWKKWHKRLIYRRFIYLKENMKTTDIHRLFNEIYRILWLDITYLLNPIIYDEHTRSHSFGKDGYFNHLEKDNHQKYSFKFFRKMLSDEEVIATVDLNVNEILIEVNLRKNDIKKLKRIFKEHNYKNNNIFNIFQNRLRSEIRYC